MDLFAKKSKAGGNADGLIKDCGVTTFVADVIDASHQVPVIVDLWAPWCGPCKQIGPLLEKLVRQAGGAVRLVKINVDENQGLAGQLQVQSIPAVFAFHNGKLVDQFVGALPESQIKAFVERLIGDDGADLKAILAGAKLALETGDHEGAGELYLKVLAQDQANATALAGLMRCYMAGGEADKARGLLARLPADIAAHADIVSVRTALELAAQAPVQAEGAIAALRGTIKANPDDHQARHDLAMACFANGDHKTAVDELLEIVRRDRSWNDDAARKQLVKLFEALGATDPMMLAGRKRLSALLFS